MNCVSGDWLHRHFMDACQTYQECQIKLSAIYDQQNPFIQDNNESTHYTQGFLEEQWHKERVYYLTRNNIREAQKVELGRLLSLQEDLNDAWLVILLMFHER